MFVLHPAYSYDSSIFIAKADIIKSAFKRADKLDPRELITVEGKIVDEELQKQHLELVETFKKAI